MRTVLGLFDNLSEAQRTIHELVRSGFNADAIGIVTSSASQRALEADPRVNLHQLDVSDVGRVAAGGPVRDALVAGNGGASLSATLRRYGVEGELAERYVAGVRKGETLEAIVVDDQDSMKAYEVMRRHSHIAQKDVLATAPIQKPVRDSRSDAHQFDEETRTIPIVREELRIGKREVETGVLRASIHIVERPVASDITLREEHIFIERRAVDRPVTTGEDHFRDDQIEMHEYAERPIASKDARVVEEVVIHKAVSEHIERIADTVRTTELAFERPFDPSLYRKHFDALGLEGERFDDYAPAYRLGHELRGDSRLSGSRWEEVEPHAKVSWEAKNPGTWEKFKEAIRHAWSAP